MSERTTLEEVRAAFESPPPARAVSPADEVGPAGASPPSGADRPSGTSADVDTTVGPQTRNESMDRSEAPGTGPGTATAARPAPDSPAQTGEGLSTADMAAAGTASLAAAGAGQPAAATAAMRAEPVPEAPAAADTVSAEPGTADSASSAVARSDDAPLLVAEQATSLRTRWQEIQTAFVDEPKSAVQQADGLVAEAMQQLAATFADERRALERQWSEGQQISTEDLRIALQRYRSFFNRLLSI